MEEKHSIPVSPRFCRGGIGPPLDPWNNIDAMAGVFVSISFLLFVLLLLLCVNAGMMSS